MLCSRKAARRNVIEWCREQRVWLRQVVALSLDGPSCWHLIESSDAAADDSGSARPCGTVRLQAARSGQNPTLAIIEAVLLGMEVGGRRPSHDRGDRASEGFPIDDQLQRWPQNSP